MKMYSLNKKHSKLIEKYMKFVQSIIYEATEDCGYKKFSDFNEILVNIVNYINAFKTMVKSNNRLNEWAYMIPNLILYSSMGFMTGIKNKNNSDEIDKLQEVLFEKTLDFVGETSDILTDIKTKENIRERILTIKKEKNELNSKN